MATELYTWGWGKDGQLGHGDRISQKGPHRVDFLANKGLREISCGGWHTTALTGAHPTTLPSSYALILPPWCLSNNAPDPHWFVVCR